MFGFGDWVLGLGLFLSCFLSFVFQEIIGDCVEVLG